MSDNTGIQWTDATWNPVSGCSKVSPGCKNCYAERDWARLSKNPKSPYFGRAFTDVRCHPERLDQPLRWRTPRKIFVNSMSDLFHEDVPESFLDEVFTTMANARKHTFQVLTKRAERMCDYVTSAVSRIRAGGPVKVNEGWPLLNVWLGVSVENQATADERISILMQTPAAVRFLSLEPLLGPIDLGPIHVHGEPQIQWVIGGGESGPRARVFDIDWARSLRDQCRAAHVAFYLKQLGSWPIEFPPQNGHPHVAASILRLRDGHGGDPAEWPRDLQDCREFPR